MRRIFEYDIKGVPETRSRGPAAPFHLVSAVSCPFPAPAPLTACSRAALRKQSAIFFICRQKGLEASAAIAMQTGKGFGLRVKQRVAWEQHIKNAGLSAIEAWYGRVSSSIDMPAMADHLANVEKADVPSLDAELPPRLVEVLKVYATSVHREYSSYLRHIRRSDGRADARLASLLRQSSVSDGLDLYLLCLFGQIL